MLHNIHSHSAQYMEAPFVLTDCTYLMACRSPCYPAMGLTFGCLLNPKPQDKRWQKKKNDNNVKMSLLMISRQGLARSQEPLEDLQA